MPTKVTVNLPDQTVEAIKEIAEKRGTTVTEALRQAIESQRFFQDEVDNGNKVLIKNPDQSFREVLFNIPKRSSSA
jgi:Ribbon-helix-helix protein, copG family